MENFLFSIQETEKITNIPSTIIYQITRRKSLKDFAFPHQQEGLFSPDDLFCLLLIKRLRVINVSYDEIIEILKKIITEYKEQLYEQNYLLISINYKGILPIGKNKVDQTMTIKMMKNEDDFSLTDATIVIDLAPIWVTLKEATKKKKQDQNSIFYTLEDIGRLTGLSEKFIITQTEEKTIKPILSSQNLFNSKYSFNNIFQLLLIEKVVNCLSCQEIKAILPAIKQTYSCSEIKNEGEYKFLYVEKSNNNIFVKICNMTNFGETVTLMFNAQDNYIFVCNLTDVFKKLTKIQKEARK